MIDDDRTATEQQPLRLLIPITAMDDSRWGVAYALHLREMGQAIEVCLLNVGEIITQWEVLRFRTQAEIASFQEDRAEAFIEEASLPLIERDIPCRGIFRRGAVEYSILDTAEELACDQIVMPRPRCGIFSLFSRDIVTSVVRSQRDIPVVLVDQEGLADTRPLV